MNTAGTLSRDAALAATNERCKNAVIMALDHPDVFHPSFKSGSDFKGFIILGRHLKCLTVLLKAKASLTDAQHLKVLNALEIIDPENQVSSCRQPDLA